MTLAAVVGKVTRMKDIPIILLAAGRSRRMGNADKLMQPVDGVPLLLRAAETARAVGHVIVALPPAPHPRYRALDGLDVEKVAIPDADEGMNASLRGAMACVPALAPAVMVLLADLPDLTSADLIAVLQSMDDHPSMLIWRGASETGIPGHPVIFDQSLFADLSRLTGDAGAQSIVRKAADKVHVQPLPEQNATLDLDTPGDWAQWRLGRTP